MASALFAHVEPAGASEREARCLDDRLSASLIRLNPAGSRLTAVIAPTLGGQLVGLQVERGGLTRELLYRGMDFCPSPGFAGKAMVMWPATGRSFADDPAAGSSDPAGWWWQGRRWPMPIHGFAKEETWVLVSAPEKSDRASATIAMRDTPQTRALFPFSFRLSITYALRGNRLSVIHRVTNRSKEAMPFSIGNHITFALPLAGEGRASETRVSADGWQRLQLDSFGRPAGRVTSPPLLAMPLSVLGTERALPLLWSGFRRQPSVTLIQPDVGLIVVTQQSSRPKGDRIVAFNLWGNVDKGFFSPEPWYGRQNALADHGVVRLPPNQGFTWAFTADIRL